MRRETTAREGRRKPLVRRLERKREGQDAGRSDGARAMQGQP